MDCGWYVFHFNIRDIEDFKAEIELLVNGHREQKTNIENLEAKVKDLQFNLALLVWR